MRVEVVTPEDFMGDVMGDLNSRRGRIEGMERRATRKWFVPWCRWRRCSVTRPICARRRRAGRCTPCTSRTTKRCLRTSLKSSFRAPKGKAQHKRLGPLLDADQL